MPRWNQTQKVIAIVALAAALYVVGRWVTAPRPPTGWTGYAPLSSGPNFALYGGIHPWVRAVTWLILIAVWVIASFALVRPRPSSDS